MRALTEQSSYLPSLAPKTLLNTQITGARRFAAQSWPLAKIRAVAKGADCTINDVVLAMCAGALRRYLMSLDALPDAPLIAMTPVSLRQAGAELGGNAVGVILCNLATDIADPAARLAAVKASMDDGKASLRSMTPAQVAVASAAQLLPLLFSSLTPLRRVVAPPYNLVISNVPGPQGALYWNGAKLEGRVPPLHPDGRAGPQHHRHQLQRQHGLRAHRLPADGAPPAADAHLSRRVDGRTAGGGHLGKRAAAERLRKTPDHTPA